MYLYKPTLHYYMLLHRHGMSDCTSECNPPTLSTGQLRKPMFASTYTTCYCPIPCSLGFSWIFKWCLVPVVPTYQWHGRSHPVGSPAAGPASSVCRTWNSSGCICRAPGARRTSPFCPVTAARWTRKGSPRVTKGVVSNAPSVNYAAGGRINNGQS